MKVKTLNWRGLKKLNRLNHWLSRKQLVYSSIIMRKKLPPGKKSNRAYCKLQRLTGSIDRLINNRYECSGKEDHGSCWIHDNLITNTQVPPTSFRAQFRAHKSALGSIRVKSLPYSIRVNKGIATALGSIRVFS